MRAIRATAGPSPDPAVFMEFLPRIKQATDAVINITTGGGMGMTLEQRLAGALAARPEMCSLNMGSMNFGIFPLADRYKQWKFDWEEPYLAIDRRPSSSATRSVTSSAFCACSARSTARASSTNAMTSAISTTSPISSIAGS